MEKYKPTNGMVREAKKGLDFRKKYKRGGTLVGVARARDIINGKFLPIKTVARMYSFFKRHEVDQKAEGWNKGEKGYPSNGKIAWCLWGGDPGYSWSTKIWEKYKRDRAKTNEASINDTDFLKKFLSEDEYTKLLLILKD